MMTLHSNGRGTANLPLLEAVAQMCADYLGVALVTTSYIRPGAAGHMNGDSLDVAPRLLQLHHDTYPNSKGSDPVLCYKSVVLIPLMKLGMVRVPALGENVCLLAIENDHIHLQVGIPQDTRDAGRVIPFAFPKDMRNRYADSLSRQRMGYHGTFPTR